MVLRLAACLAVLGCAAALCAPPALAATCKIAKGETTSLGKPAAQHYARQRLQREVETIKGRLEAGGLQVRVKERPIHCRVWLDLGPIGTEYICTATAEICGT